MYYLILSVIAGMCWGFTTVTEKFKLLKYFEPYDLLVIRSTFIIAIFLFLLFKNIKSKKSNLIKKISKIDKKLAFILMINSFVSITGTFLFFYILNKNKVVNTVSTIYAVSIVSPIILAYLVFSEIMNIYQLIGVLLIIPGIYLVNCKV